MNLSLRQLFAFLFVCFFLLPGCTRLVSHRVATWQPGAAPATQPIPESAIYSIRFLDENGNKIGGIPGSHRFLRKGEVVGFRADEEGNIYAQSTIYSFRIDLPPGHGAVWSSHYHKRTQFGKEVSKAADATGKAVVGAAAVVGAGVVIGAALVVGAAADCDD